ncbi:MAG: hypothetical protein D6765_11825, partial [Bacteroidetes bacterium]
MLPLRRGWILLCLATLACQRDSLPKPQPPTPPPLRLDRPAVGQQSRYLLLKGFNYLGSSPLFEYAPDTLVVRIVGRVGEDFLVEERTTPLSRSEPLISMPDSVFHYRLRLDGDTLRVFRQDDRFILQSRLFLHNDRQSFPLQLSSDTLLHWNGWRVEPLCLLCSGLLEGHLQLGKIYDTLQVLVNNLGTQYDGPGYT